MSDFPSTKNVVSYMSVRLSRDAKFLEAKDGKPAVTYLSFFHGTKDGEDLPIDARVIRGASLFRGLKKGDYVSLAGPLTFKKNHKGDGLVGVIWDVVDVATNVNLKERNGESPAPAFE